METHLRPLSLGEILDRTAQLYRSNFWLFAGISAVYSGTLLLVSLAQIGAQEYLRAEHLNRYLIWLTAVGFIFEFFVVFVVGGLAVAANNRAVAWVHMGEPATIRGAYASILPRTGRYLWLMILIGLVIWTPLLLAYVGYVCFLAIWIWPTAGGKAAHLAVSSAQPSLLFIGVTVAFVLVGLAGIAYAILMALRYALAIAASVVEDLKARPAMRRSVELSRGSRGRIFVLGLLVLVIQVGLVSITQAFFVVTTLKHGGQLAPGARVLQQLVAFITNTFIGPMYATGLTLFYYDQRVRKEGYDIEWMMQAAGMTRVRQEADGISGSGEAGGSPEAGPGEWSESSPGGPRIAEPSRVAESDQTGQA